MEPEIIQRFKDNDFSTESELIRTMKNTLMTVRQRQQLFEANLEISDILNGKYPVNSTLIPELFADWNQKLGFVFFRGFIVGS